MGKKIAILFCFLTVSFSFNEITAQENRQQELIDEINLVRSNPSGYVAYIQDFLDYWESSASEKATAQELIKVLKKTKPMNKLAYSEKLGNLAKQHCEWISKTSNFKHSKFGFAENIQYGNDIIRFAVIDLLIDHGVPGRGHRKNLLNPDFKYIGVFEIEKSSKDMNNIIVQIFE